MTFQTLLKHYSKKVADNTVAPLLEAHLVHTIITQKTVNDSQMGKNLFYSIRDCKVTALDNLTISFHRRQVNSVKKRFAIEGAGDTLFFRKYTSIKTCEIILTGL